MKKTIITFYFLILTFDFFGQTVTQKLQQTFSAFEKDSQLKHAISSLYVIDANTGQVVFDKNSQIGLAPASTQKIITSVTAFELLGKDYRYKTEFAAISNHDKDVVLWIRPSGDPTFGSWRWSETQGNVIMKEILKSLEDKNLFVSKTVIDNSGWDMESIPDGWIWQDIGNYYGAGAHKFCFRENQYDILLKSGKNIGDPVTIVDVIPEEYHMSKIMQLGSKLKSAAKKSGDNAYVYIPDERFGIFEIRGTIPVDEDSFRISASDLEPEWAFLNYFSRELVKKKFALDTLEADVREWGIPDNSQLSPIYTHLSPSMDSIIYWFNKKSINLYGEALIKTFAYEKNGFGSTDSGVAIAKKFWKEKGMDENELNIVDGSGLSPLDRVTTHAQVEILKYAKSKDWFPYFLNALPEYNKMTMKSGTINGVKGFCGYHKASNGKEYIFSFLVNNYSGSASALVNKMYKVLDILK